MRAILFISTSVLVLALMLVARAERPKSADALAAAPQSVVYDADSAFEFIKTMVGEWNRSSGDHDHGSTSHAVTFRVTAAGSSVLETIFPGDDNEMLSVYHMDGDNLLLTHYCALQNAPILKFEKSDKPGEIKFAFQGGTNFDPQVDLHVHEGTFKIKDANTVESTFITFADNKPRPALSAVIKRKVAK